MRTLLPVLFTFLIAGCASTKPPVSTPYGRCIDAIEAGQIYAGQTVTELLERSDPLVMIRAGRFKSFHYNEIPGYAGLTVVTKDERVARAYSWNDYSEPHDFFNTLTKADKAELKEASRWDK